MRHQQSESHLSQHLKFSTLQEQHYSSLLSQSPSYPENLVMEDLPIMTAKLVSAKGQSLWSVFVVSLCGQYKIRDLAM